MYVRDEDWEVACRDAVDIPDTSYDFLVTTVELSVSVAVVGEDRKRVRWQSHRLLFST